MHVSKGPTANLNPLVFSLCSCYKGSFIARRKIYGIEHSLVHIVICIREVIVVINRRILVISGAVYIVVIAIELDDIPGMELSR